MKNLYFSLIFLLSIISCSSDDGNFDQTSYIFFTDSKISLTTVDSNSFANIEYGSNLVFMFEFIKADSPEIQDDEYAERLIFEIDHTLNQFTYNAEEVLVAKAYFNQSCFCPSTGSIPITTGTIEGSRLDSDDWMININIHFTINNKQQSRSINKVFTNSELFRQSY